MASDDLQVRRDLVIPGDELQMSTSRSGGPGGQSVNKTSSRVTLRWSVAHSRVLGDARRRRLLERLASRLTSDGELVLHVESERSQLENRRIARERLVEVVNAALHVPKARRATKPTKGSQRRRVKTKRQRGDTKRLRKPPSGDD